MRKNKINKMVSVLLTLFLWVFLFSCKNSDPLQQQSDASDETPTANPQWAIELIDAYEALDKNRNTKSADLLLEATNLMHKKNWENYLVCATIYAPNEEDDKAFLAIEKALEAGLRDSGLLNSIPELSSLKNDSRWEALIAKTEQTRKEYLEAIENPKLLAVLEEMWTADQAALSEYEKNRALLDSTATSKDDDRLFEPVENRWEINKNKLDSIIEIHGWPGNKLVGEDGAKIAWAIPQHHPDVFFKEKCLSLIKKAVEEGDFDPNHFAELTDRIARTTWQKQTYGASMGQKAPYPIENPSQVNQRRFALGLLEPVEVYAYYHGVAYRLPTAEEAKLEAKTVFDEAQSNYKEFEKFLTAQEIDSALSYIKKGIQAYGDLSNEQLYKASIKLANQPDENSKKLSLRIVKVLIWRKWDRRFETINEANYATYDAKDWNKINTLLQKSN